MNTMKYLFFYLIPFLLISNTAYSQQKLIKKISNEVCTCMDKGHKKGTGISSKKLAENCVSEILTKSESQIRKVYGDDFFNEGKAAGEKLGLEIVRVLAKDCEIFVRLVAESKKSEDNQAKKYYERAEEEKKNENYSNAIWLYSKAISIEPVADYLNSRGTTYYLSGNAYYAISDFIRASELDSSKAIYSYNLAYTLYELNDLSTQIYQHCHC